MLPAVVQTWQARWPGFVLVDPFRLGVRLPRRLGSRSGYRLLGSDVAYEALRVAAEDGGPGATLIGVTPHPVTIRSIRLGEVSFVTDRGRQRLPIWVFSFTGSKRSAAVLGVAHLFTFTSHRQPVTGATVVRAERATCSPSGTRLSLLHRWTRRRPAVR